MVKIVLEKISIDDVMREDKIRYNTNNHWIDNKKPSDYQQVLKASETHVWINHFKPNYQKITINLKENSWLIHAHQIGRHTCLFPSIYSEEKDELVAKLEQLIDLQGKDWFVRTESVSLKCGQHGAGPYRALSQVIESLVTCLPSHTPNFFEEELITLYFIPWITLSPQSEYRVFICEGMMTAISQQHLYTVYPEYDRVKDVQLIYSFFHHRIRPVIPLASYSIDIAVLNKSQLSSTSSSTVGEEMDENSLVYFIEINGFGKEYAAGSSLFGWIEDEEILYGRKSTQLPDDQRNLIVDENEMVPITHGDDVEERNAQQQFIYLRYTIRPPPKSEESEELKELKELRELEEQQESEN